MQSNGTVIDNTVTEPTYVYAPGEPYDIMQEISNGSLQTPEQAEVNPLNNPNLGNRPPLETEVRVQAKYSAPAEQQAAINNAREGFGRGASKTSAWVRIVNEVLNFWYNYPK